MILIGISGPIKHGKTSFANALMSQYENASHLESSTLIASVADALHAATQQLPDPDNIEQINVWLQPLVDILQAQTHVQLEFSDIAITESEQKEHPEEYEKLFEHLRNLRQNRALVSSKITPNTKEHYRPILQWLGGYLVKKVDTGIWYKELVRQAAEKRQSGCQLCVIGGLRYPTDAAIVREAGGIIVTVIRPDMNQSDTQDPTERERDLIQSDTTIINNGTLADLSGIAKRLTKDIKANNIAPQYSAKNVLH